MQSKDQIEASLLSKQEAAIRRERALAYAFSHQVLYNVNVYRFQFIDDRAFIVLENMFVPVEELFEVDDSLVHRPEQPTMGLELVRAMDGVKAMGVPKHNR